MMPAAIRPSAQLVSTSTAKKATSGRPRSSRLKPKIQCAAIATGTMPTESLMMLQALSAAISSVGRSGLVSRLPRLRDHISSMKVVEKPIFERNRMSQSSTEPISTPAAMASGPLLSARYFCRKPQVSICRNGQ